MKIQLQLEGLALMLAGIAGYGLAGFNWWWFAGFFLAPDISMLGYVVNTKVGAITYNLFHHLMIATLCIAAGYLLNTEWVQMAGWILFAHIGFDRMLGYGLKYPDAFKHTHLDKF
ncbi:DUF4260 domain-containing protein [Nonlabens ponticola]|uniref:DUF4260 family protein n=1 Tax=Nonlabens ponticola TaxID=2496866 RepID=A0A3S9MUM2_9FLAO|nr:DUF4260 domain-containing protein [Nonlabens ponticola]AZQ42875.1 DUF4260 family protein [Nonlabens ponticola]